MSDEYKIYYTAVRCPCGDAVCKQWVVNNAELRLGEEEAKAVADLLNQMCNVPDRWLCAPLQPTPEMLYAAGIPRIAAIGVWTNMMNAKPKVPKND